MNVITEFNLIKLPEFPKFLDEGLTPATKEIGRTLGNIFYAVFSGVNYPIEKLKLKQAEYLKKYELDIKNELSKVPEDKLVSPPLNIVGPALDASKFYIEEDEIRKMFAKLIASSMNSSLAESSHPSFVEIIKQISIVEAQIIKHLSNNSLLPYVELVYKGSGDNLNVFQITEPYTKLKDLDADYSITASSIKNLQRLGLIKFLDITVISDENLLNELINDKIFSSYHYVNKILKEENKRLQDGEISIKNGNISLTTYGLRFSKVCL